jgi:hypothetical protein
VLKVVFSRYLPKFLLVAATSINDRNTDSILHKSGWQNPHGLAFTRPPQGGVNAPYTQNIIDVNALFILSGC